MASPPKGQVRRYLLDALSRLWGEIGIGANRYRTFTGAHYASVAFDVPLCGTL